MTLGGPAADKQSRLIRTQCFKNSYLEWRHIYLLNYECDTYSLQSHWQKVKSAFEEIWLLICELPPMCMFVPRPLLAINITQCQQIEAAPEINYCRSDVPLFCAAAFSPSRFISQVVVSGAPLLSRCIKLLLNLFLAVANLFDYC